MLLLLPSLDAPTVKHRGVTSQCQLMPLVIAEMFQKVMCVHTDKSVWAETTHQPLQLHDTLGKNFLMLVVTYTPLPHAAHRCSVLCLNGCYNVRTSELN